MWVVTESMGGDGHFRLLRQQQYKGTKATWEGRWCTLIKARRSFRDAAFWAWDFFLWYQFNFPLACCCFCFSLLCTYERAFVCFFQWVVGIWLFLRCDKLAVVECVKWIKKSISSYGDNQEGEEGVFSPSNVVMDPNRSYSAAVAPIYGYL